MQQNSGRASPSCCGRRTRCSRGREAPRLGCGCPPPCPPLYRPPRRGRRPWEIKLPRGGGGQGGWSAPQGKWGAPPPPPRVSTLGAGGGPSGVHQPTMGSFPSPLQPLGPSGMGGPTRWTPGTLPVVPVQYRVTPKLSRWPKQHFLYIILYLQTIPELLMTSGISSGTPNNIRFAA